MNTEIRQFVGQELMSDNQEVRSQFINHFNKEIETFITAMASAYEAWQTYDKTVGTDRRPLCATMSETLPPA